MASIYQRGKEKVYYGRAWIGGKERRKSLETTSRAVAEGRLTTWIEGQKAIRWGEKPKRKFTETADRFTREHLTRLKPTSQKRYVHSLIHLYQQFQDMHLEDIGSAALSAFEQKRREDGVTAGSIRRDLSCLSSMFRCAEEWEYFAGNPAAAYLRSRARRGLKEAPPRTRYLSHEEEQAHFDHIAMKLRTVKSARDKHGYRMMEAALAFAIDTGLRKEEQLSVTWRLIDLEQSQVAVPDAKAKSGVGRLVPLLPRTVALLKALPRHRHSTYVFWTGDGRRYTHLYQQLVRISAKLGIKDVRWHDLRRTCGCRLLQDRNLSLERVAGWLGHSSTTITGKVYAFLDVRHLHRAIADSDQERAQRFPSVAHGTTKPLEITYENGVAHG